MATVITTHALKNMITLCPKSLTADDHQPNNQPSKLSTNAAFYIDRSLTIIPFIAIQIR
jgi:hypothetical protein